MKKFIRFLKGCVKSMTVWFNGVMVTVMLALPDVMDLMPQLKEYVQDDIYKKLMLTVLVVNILLRFKTDRSIGDKGAPRS